jgi:putative Holliday junction resolvase
MRILGLDVGTVRIGIAVSDETETIARGVGTLERQSWKKDLQTLVEYAGEFGAVKLVVGNPFNMDGSRGAQAAVVDKFVERLKEVLPLPIDLWDERLSSLSAERVLIEGGMQRSKRKQVIDKLAAVIILQSYLDSRGSRMSGSSGENSIND